MREIPSAETLSADVEGHIEDVDGVLRITRIHLRYRATIPRGSREKAERALAVYAEQCPAWQSVRGCIECSWDAAFTEAD